MSLVRLTVAAFAGALLCASAASAEGLDDPTRADFAKALEGKKVAFVPLAMGFDLAEGWTYGVRKEVDAHGGQFILRDPNWKTDVGAQAITKLIAEKPDVMIVHNPDVQSYARILKKAEEAGIYVIQINMKSSYPTDAFIGTDFISLGEQEANAVLKKCGKGSGTSGKVAIVQGMLTAAASAYQIRGIDNILNQHPEIKVVSNQSADWDASKAHALTATVLQQHPDLCGIIGFWDGMDIGSGAAVREAGKQGQVYIVTNGGGEQMACNNLKDGTFGAYVSFDVPGQARDMNDAIKMLLQSHLKPGSVKFSLYTPLQVLTKDNLKPDSCWSLKEIEQAKKS